jgi:hypothetical protein
MHARTPVIPTSPSVLGRPVPLVPRCRRTGLTKPECHCPPCLLEQIAAHGAPAARPAFRATAADEPATAGVIL